MRKCVLLTSATLPRAVKVAGKSLEDAVYNAEELEETAKLFFLLEGRRARFLDGAQIADLEKNFPS